MYLQSAVVMADDTDMAMAVMVAMVMDTATDMGTVMAMAHVAQDTDCIMAPERKHITIIPTMTSNKSL